VCTIWKKTERTKVNRGRKINAVECYDVWYFYNFFAAFHLLKNQNDPLRVVCAWSVYWTTSHILYWIHFDYRVRKYYIIPASRSSSIAYQLPFFNKLLWLVVSSAYFFYEDLKIILSEFLIQFSVRVVNFNSIIFGKLLRFLNLGLSVFWDLKNIKRRKFFKNLLSIKFN
jgi:hypothetical protein